MYYLTGSVKWFSRVRGFGHINTPELPGLDVFVHYSDIADGRPGQRNLYPAQQVQFDAVPNVIDGRYKGWKAINVKLLREQW